MKPASMSWQNVSDIRNFTLVMQNLFTMKNASCPHLQSVRFFQLLRNDVAGILQSNGVALVNGSVSPLTPAVTPTGSTTVLRPNWSHSPLPSPSQSPFLTQQVTWFVVRMIC